jgi:hypothetical protein
LLTRAIAAFSSSRFAASYQLVISASTFALVGQPNQALSPLARIAV